jgi:hypothetical protein
VSRLERPEDTGCRSRRLALHRAANRARVRRPVTIRGRQRCRRPPVVAACPSGRSGWSAARRSAARPTLTRRQPIYIRLSDWIVTVGAADRHMVSRSSDAGGQDGLQSARGEGRTARRAAADLVGARGRAVRAAGRRPVHAGARNRDERHRGRGDLVQPPVQPAHRRPGAPPGARAHALHRAAAAEGGELAHPGAGVDAGGRAGLRAGSPRTSRRMSRGRSPTRT